MVNLIDKKRWISRLDQLLPLLNVLLFSLLVYFFAYDTQQNIIWDENYHLTSAQRYIEGVAHFEAHPPLGKMLIAAGEMLTDTNAGIDKHRLVFDKYISGDDLPVGFSFFGMRLMSTVFGFLSCVAFYFITLRLTRNTLYAMFLSSLFIFENAFAVHFRAAHLDAFQMLFVLLFLLSIISYWLGHKPVKSWQYAWLGCLCGLAVMVKVNAIVLAVFFVFLFFKETGYFYRLKTVDLNFFVQLLKKALSAFLGAVAVVASIFYVSVLMTDQLPEQTSPIYTKDTTFMSPVYLEYLQGTRSLDIEVLGNAIADYYTFMKSEHLGVATLDLDSPIETGSPVWMWPLEQRNINYRWDSANGYTRYVQLAGNHLGWALGVLAISLALTFIAYHRLSGLKLTERGENIYQLLEVFVVAYFAFMALHWWLSEQRVMYLYHYFIGLLFSYIVFLLVFLLCTEISQRFSRQSFKAVVILAVTLAGCFYYVAPLTYSLPLDKAACERQNIIHQTVQCQ